MTKVIQAACPGCKKSLRIPADWIQQAIRCKYCGLLMAAKQQPPAAIHAPAAPQTPAPKKRLDSVPRATPAVPASSAIPQAKVAAPMAILVSPGTPFDNLEDDPPRNQAPRPSPKGRGGWWKGPIIALGVLVLAGIALGGAFTIGWPYLGPRLLPASTQTVQNNSGPKDNEPGDSSTKQEPDKKVEPKEEPKKPDPKPDPKKPDPKPDPKKPDPKPDPTKTPDPKKPDPKPEPPKPPVAGTAFPRRALVISVHNYVYANPVGAGLVVQGGRNLGSLTNKLNTTLRFPMSQIAHLSDEALKDRRAPVKVVIEKTLHDFLAGSRDQDRVMVFLIGHCAEIDGEGYFVPIEGEPSNAASLLPLKWIYEEMKNCPARQKILVLDTARFSPTHGVERPGSFQNGDAFYGPMTAKFDALLKEPPDGVQVWSSCVAEQLSYELGINAMGLFLDKLTTVLEKSIQSSSQRPEESIPVEKMNDLVTAAMKDELTKLSLTQTPRLTGKEKDGGAAYDAKAKMPDPPVLAASTNNKANVKIVQSVLNEISTPPVKGTNFADATIKFEMLPPFDDQMMKMYEGNEESMLAGPIQKARAVLWAISMANPPEALKADVEAFRSRSKVNLSFIKDGFAAPKDDKRFKEDIGRQELQMADLIGDVEDAYKKFMDVEFDREKEPKRWVANYDFMKARMEEQIAYLYEYQSMLGQIRKDLLPPLEKEKTGANGWKLASTGSLNGDVKGKKMAGSSAKKLSEMADKLKGTPWEVLAKREKLTTLGLEWKTATIAAGK